MYKVIRSFSDLQDKNRVYNAGDTFPRDGLKVSKERIAELLSGKNRIREPLIEEIPEELEGTKVDVGKDVKEITPVKTSNKKGKKKANAE